MQVILQENFPSLGFVGDVVNVKPGFARNFLFPRNIALAVSDSNIKLLTHRKKMLEIKKAQKKSEAEAFKKKVDAVTINLEHAAEGERLYGSVTITEIYAELQKQGLEIDRKLLKLEAPIRLVGSHKVEVKLHQDVSAFVTVNVIKKAEPVLEVAEKKKAVAKKAPKAKKAEEEVTETSEDA